WVKAPDLVLDFAAPLPFLAFDDECFYRAWALAADTLRAPRLETVLRCSSTSAIVSALTSGLGMALLGERHLQPGLECLGAPRWQPSCAARPAAVSRRRRRWSRPLWTNWAP